MAKIALAMIVKAADSEAALLDRCLASVKDHVDGIFLTITGQNKACEDVADKYGAIVSHFPWINDFAKARNFSFLQVSKDYTHIFWVDCDDVVENADKIRGIIDAEPTTDAFIMNYLYDFDEWNNPVVVHLKTRIVKNDGCVEWEGELHEDFKTNRKINAKLAEGVNIIHLPGKEHLRESAARNVIVSESQLKYSPEDPRSYWNVGNSYILAERYDEAIEAFTTFFKKSRSEEEKYIAHQRVAECYVSKNDLEKALDHVRIAIGLRSNYPDAYTLAGNILLAMGRVTDSVEVLKKALELEPSYSKVIVYNPRNYDLVPMKLLSKAYILLGFPQLALPLLEGCSQITPKDTKLAEIVAQLRVESDKADAIMKDFERLKTIDDDNELKKEIESLPEDFQNHPAICRLKNTRFIKKESSGKDIVFFCGQTFEEWTPKTAIEKGIGGSEEAVINLSRELVKKGWNVIVYNSCGHKEQEFDGVIYKPFWAWNYRDRQDVTVLWRSPSPCDFEINSSKVFVDLHDVVNPAEFTEKRLARITGVFVKSEYHKSLFSPETQKRAYVVQNGINCSMFEGKERKDEKLVINTSSPDRSLSAFISIAELVKKEIPDAKFQWAYGWNVFDAVHKDSPDRLEWKARMLKRMKDVGIVELGRLGHEDIAKLYKKAGIFLYPTKFSEIDCISARKAQASGAYPVTTNFGALKETVQFGDSFDSTGDPQGEEADFGVTGKSLIIGMAQAVIRKLKEPASDIYRNDMREAMRKYDWSSIADAWSAILSS